MLRCVHECKHGGYKCCFDCDHNEECFECGLVCSEYDMVEYAVDCPKCTEYPEEQDEE